MEKEKSRAAVGMLFCFVLATIVGVDLYSSYQHNREANAALEKYAPRPGDYFSQLANRERAVHPEEEALNDERAVEKLVQRNTASRDGTLNDMAAVDAAVGAKETSASASGARLGITMAGFNSIQDGMGYTDVVKIVGEEGVLQSHSSIGTLSTSMYGWSAAGGANMSVMFQNDAVVMKSQVGLE